MKEICHKYMLMFIAISLITHCDQDTFFWLAEQVYSDTCIKYIPQQSFLVSKIGFLFFTLFPKQAKGSCSMLSQNLRKIPSEILSSSHSLMGGELTLLSVHLGWWTWWMLVEVMGFGRHDGFW